MTTPRHIRPIAICLFRNGNRILVSDGWDAQKKNAYCRPLGGAIEFGESSADAVVREIREELGVEIGIEKRASTPMEEERHELESTGLRPGRAVPADVRPAAGTGAVPLSV